MNRLFGTDGVRGVVGKELTRELAYKLGMAAAKVLTKNRNFVPKILVGCDTRESCDMLMDALVAGIEKGDGTLHVPDAQRPLEEGDVLWIVGEQKDLEVLLMES